MSDATTVSASCLCGRVRASVGNATWVSITCDKCITTMPWRVRAWFWFDEWLHRHGKHRWWHRKLICDPLDRHWLRRGL